MREKVLIIFILSLVFVFGVHTLTSINQDIGRHLVLGEMIWKTRSVPDTNMFSFTAPGFPFINHHWLGEVMIYLGTRTAGLKGLIVFKAVILVSAFGLVLTAFWRKETALISAVIGGISVFILAERTDVRPEILSFLFLGWFLFVLFRRPYSRLLYTLPLVEILWVNTHIYFFTGLVIYGWFLAGELVKNNFKFNFYDTKNRQLLLTGVALIAAVFVNPNGWQGGLYPLHIFDNYGYSVMENKGPFFLRAFGYPWMTTWALFIGIFAGLAGFVANWRRLKENISGLGIFAMTAVFSIMMVRNYPLFGLTLLPITVKNFFEAGWHPRNLKAELAVMVILASLILSVAGNQVYLQNKTGQRFGLHIPNGAQKGVDFVRMAGIHGPMFNNFDVGSFLIWKLPEERVFIDGRPEAYPDDFIQKVYIKMQEDPDIWEKYSEEYKINFIFWNYYDITPWSQKFVKRILKDPEWVLVYKDGSTIVLVKNIPQNRAIIAKYRVK